MRDKDAILLEQIISEMGSNLSYTKTLPKIRIDRAQTPEEQSKRVMDVQKEVPQLLKNLDSNPDDYNSAREIYNVVNRAVSTDYMQESTEDEVEDEDEDSSMMDASSSKIANFLIDNEDLSWKDIYQKVLEKTITDLHDYRKLLPKDQGGEALKIDHFMNEKIAMKDPNGGLMKDENGQIVFYKKTPEDRELIRSFYLIYEKILNDLDIKVTPRSCKELPGTHAESVYYFDNNDNPIKTTVYVRADGKTCPGSFGKRRLFLGRRSPKVKGYPKWSPSELVEQPFEKVLELIKNTEAYEAYAKKFPSYVEDEYGNQIPSEFSFLYTGGQPPRGFLKRYWEKEDAKNNGESLEEESYKTFLEQWNRVDDFENESEEDLYNDEDEEEEGCSCGGEEEDCSCEGEFQE
jgi:hypothetical protein